MNIIAFLGSPRRGGNTETLLKEAVKGTGLDVRLFDLNRMDISPCQNCGGCEDTGQCTVDDAMQEIHRAIREAHKIILASPVFFMGLSAQAKTMIDRCQAFWCEKYLLKKEIPQGEHGRRGLLLLVGGMKKDEGIKCCERTATAFFRTISVPGHATLSYTGVDEKGAIIKHPTALRDAFEAGRELAK
jgi:multimeric flavodoxin WrbA